MIAAETWPAPAKLNLFLHITGRRDDGYHLLQTVFQFLDFGDELAFVPRTDGTIVRRYDLPGVAAESDLCVRAARALQIAAGVTAGVEIDLIKRIPQGGGLGGGSSDAATVLLVLNRLWAIDWPLARLAALGARLGADVPVFVAGHAAWAEGVGERLTPVDPELVWYVVLLPPVNIQTRAVFAAFATGLGGVPSAHPTAGFVENSATNSATNAGEARQLTAYSTAITIRDFHAGRTRNDLEPLVRASHPAVAAAIDWLCQYGNARMTGSGACVFLPVPSEAAGQEILLKSRQLGPTFSGFVAPARNVHPVHARLGL